MKILYAVLLALSLSSGARGDALSNLAGRTYDLVVVGGTPGGVACAVRAAREGMTVLLVNHTTHLGGFISSGAGGWEAPYDGMRSPLYAEMLRGASDYYKTTYGEQSQQYLASLPDPKSNAHIDRPKVEPRVAEMLFEQMVAREQMLAVLRNYYVVGVDRKGARINSVTFREMHGVRNLVISATSFADCMYEADLVAAAGAPSIIGRESRSTYNEPHAGIIYSTEREKPARQLGFPKDAAEGRLKIRYNSHATGTLLPQSTGKGDSAVMSYNYRLILTKDPANRITVKKPANYISDAASKISSGSYVPGLPNATSDRPNVVPNLPNHKIAWNGGKLIGPQNEYPAGDWSARERISKLYLDTMLSLLWFYQNDSAAPKAEREYWKDYGLAADEFVDNDHVPYEIYVREARRLVGRYIFTEHDAVVADGLLRTKIHADSIAMTDWPVDSVACLRRGFAGANPDGVFFLAEESRPAQIPYRALLPRGLDNLLVPVALSASHVGWGPIRLEPVWMQTGEAAGLAAALAKQQGTSLAAIDPDLLVRELVEHQFMVSFFNDVDVTSGRSWVPAVEFFGTKGFFKSYDARADAPLSSDVAICWTGAFGKIVAGEAFDANAVARTLPPDDIGTGAKMTGARFAQQLKDELARRNRGTQCVDMAMRELNVDLNKDLDRGTACSICFKATLN